MDMKVPIEPTMDQVFSSVQIYFPLALFCVYKSEAWWTIELPRIGTEEKSTQ